MKKFRNSMVIKNVPNDLKKHILKMQLELKTQKDVEQYSQEKTVLQIIKEHKEFTEKNQK